MQVIAVKKKYDHAIAATAVVRALGRKFLEVHNAGIENKKGYNAYDTIRYEISGHLEFIVE